MRKEKKRVNIKRTLQLSALLRKKSFFLFGPRAVGKSYLIQRELISGGKVKKVVLFDLLQYKTFHRLSVSHSHLENIVNERISETKIKNKDVWVVIDEVQKLPQILDEVHRLIEKKGWKFLLTGSSSRKLKRGGANLLAGRAWSAHLYPLTFHEIGAKNFNLNHHLLYGGLPFVHLSKEPEEELLAYRSHYLKEEIQMEALVKKVPQFSRFLEAAAFSSGEILNFTKLGSDYGISPSTIREYYSILEETFVGFFLEPWTKSKKRKAISKAKFYLFDLGVCHSFTETKILNFHSDLFGKSFEHWIIQEMRAYLSYRRLFLKMRYWKSVNRQEVDLTIGEEIAIEIKSTQRVSSKHLRNLKALQEEKIFKKFFLVSCDPDSVLQDDIHCLHWSEFLRRLWKDKIL
ncbi:MAG: AAA family ATPase [Bdellovibrionales bacterium]|nr:AAA family ATPase [Bdellovibrionales bacterium]